MPDRNLRMLAASLLALLSLGPAARAQEGCETLVNTLGNFSITMEFSLGGVGGLSVAREQAIGPRLILDEPKVLTEVGALAYSSLPMIVQVRPAIEGAPDPSKVIASYLLSHRQPAAFRYESVSPNLLLPAGTYFVTFTTQPNHYTESGGLEGALAQTRGVQRATSFPAGSMNTNTGESRFSEGETGAVRVLACRPPKPQGPGAAPAPPKPQGLGRVQILPGLSGYKVVTGAPVIIAEQGSGVATATCPTGKSVLGGGYQSGAPDGSSATTASMSVYSSGVAGESGWSASGFNGSPLVPNQNRKLTLTAYAVCATVQ